jgi:hypothetical protein
MSFPGASKQDPKTTELPRLLSMDSVERVSGGMMKIHGLPPITVYYADEISILTSDPSKSNVH